MILPLAAQLAPLDRRRAFSPLDLPGLKVWLRADAVTGLNDGDPVSTWSDTSGSGNHAAAQGTDAITFRVNRVNGLPAIRLPRFAGSGQGYFKVAGPLTPGTVFVVAAYTAATFGGFDGLLNADDGGADALYLTGDDTTSSWFTSAHQPGLVRYVNGAATSAIASLSAWNQFAAVDLTPVSWGAGLVIGTDRTYSTSGARDWQGEIAEVLVYDAALSDAHRQAVQAFLAAKYGLTL